MAAEETTESRVAAPGLKWVKRRASHTPIWVASADGYQPRTVNLSRFRDNPIALEAECVQLQGAMNTWKAGLREHVGGYNGTIGYILKHYQTDRDSTFFSLRPGSRHPYEYYLGRLIYEIGDRRIDSVTGIDLKRWHERWSADGEKLAASKMMRAVLDAAITFAVMSFAPGSVERRAVSELREALKAASRKLPNPKRREHTVTADQVVALREAAHKDGRPSMALAYALVFETTLRLWDVIGQWWPIDAPLMSDVVSKPYKSRKEAQKWFGLRWEDIDADLVLRYMPSKTSAKTGMSVTYPLARAAMVMEELEHHQNRSGPVVVYEGTGLPYGSNHFGDFWRHDREAAGISAKVWARDLRASGITEGRAAGVTTDDASKVAGHSSTKTTAAVYDRANLEAAERFADARTKKRGKI